MAVGPNPVFSEEGSNLKDSTALTILVVLFGFAHVMQARAQGERVVPELAGAPLVFAAVFGYFFLRHL